MQLSRQVICVASTAVAQPIQRFPAEGKLGQEVRTITNPVLYGPTNEVQFAFENGTTSRQCQEIYFQETG